MADLSRRMAERCMADGEFRLAARYWSGALSIDLGDERVSLVLTDGNAKAGEAAPGAGHIGLAAPVELWRQVLSPVPPPFLHDILPARAFGMRFEADSETFWQYFPAVRRFVDLLREERLSHAAV